MQEAIASGTGNKTVIQTLQLDHPGFSDPVRWAMIIGEPIDIGVDPTVLLPLGDGTSAVHVLRFFSFIRPGAEKDGPTEGRLRIDGASGEIYAQLKLALSYDSPIRATAREYIVGPSGLAGLVGPDAVIDDLELAEVSLDGSAAEGKLEYADGSQLNVPTGPHAFFDRVEYPTLYT